MLHTLCQWHTFLCQQQKDNAQVDLLYDSIHSFYSDFQPTGLSRILVPIIRVITKLILPAQHPRKLQFGKHYEYS
jgi:hypothetical protein